MCQLLWIRVSGKFLNVKAPDTYWRFADCRITCRQN
uniref:Uncharacterized protein n=1 Tax=Anguilla anguilla TaxID=7936 RepID=A0A0E9U986_ANGAN